MLWYHIKSWAKDNGYSSFREKVDTQNNQYDYYWEKVDYPNVSGLATSVSKLATQIYNHMTNDQFIEHQNNYSREYKYD